MNNTSPFQDAFFAAETAAEEAAMNEFMAKNDANATLAKVAFKVAFTAAIAGVGYLATRPRVKRAVAELFKAESV
jgi:hypothetical protein